MNSGCPEKVIVTSKRQTPSLIVALLLVFSLGLSAPAQTPKKRRTAKPLVKPEPAAEAPKPLSEAEKKQLDETASQSRANLITASQTYRESLERVLDLQKKDENRMAELVEKRKKLLELGLIAKRELEESEQSLADGKAKTSETQRQIEEVDQLVAEVNAAEQLAKMPPPPQGALRSSGALIRYVGASRWAMSDFTKVDAFFRLKFSRPIPVSALGQTETHNRLGFDHREAVDIAVHPDSAEGIALIDYLRSQSISFIAIRSAIHGSATGAHIHIGPGSRKLTTP